MSRMLKIGAERVGGDRGSFFFPRRKLATDRKSRHANSARCCRRDFYKSLMTRSRETDLRTCAKDIADKKVVAVSNEAPYGEFPTARNNFAVDLYFRQA